MRKTRNARAIAEIIVAVCFIVLLYFFIRYLDQREAGIETADSENQMKEEWVELSEEMPQLVIGERTYRFVHPVKSYLFIGTDASGNESAEGDDYHGAMADVLMLLTVNEEEHYYGILQLNRDTITEIPMLQADGTAYASADMQLCTAHYYGGDKKASCENTVTVVSELLGGLPIDGYYALSMEAIPLLNHAVGGVRVTLEDDMTSIDPQMYAGAQLTLTDEQALLLIQSRYAMEDDRNSERMRRQRLFMEGFFEKLGKLAGEDENFAITLYDELHPYATENMNYNELTEMLKNLSGYTNRGIYTIDGTAKVGQQLADGKEHWEFYVDEGSLDAAMCALYPLVFSGEDDREDNEG